MDLRRLAPLRSVEAPRRPASSHYTKSRKSYAGGFMMADIDEDSDSSGESIELPTSSGEGASNERLVLNILNKHSLVKKGELFCY